MKKEKSKTPKWFVLDCTLYPSSALGKPPRLPRGSWMTGQKITYPVEEPLVYPLDPDYPGKLLPLYESAAPLMRDDLIKAIHEAGANNLQLFKAILKDQKGKEYTNYKAVNIIGLVACADWKKSKTMGTTDSKIIDADFDSLVIDEKKADASGLQIFRLAESVSAIVVNEKVKKKIEEKKIEGMMFQGPGEWSG